MSHRASPAPISDHKPPSLNPSLPLMLIGNKASFAIESGITHAYEEPGLRALGYFILHIGGGSFGVRAADASLLANVFDEAQNILARRGQHVAPFASEADAGAILDAIQQAIYAENPPEARFFGLPLAEFRDTIYASHAGWHWAGDEAFDDGSTLFHFDVGDRVRLIADRSPRDKQGLPHDAATLKDVWLPADEFYDVVGRWRNAFAEEWKLSPKMPAHRR